MPNVHLNIAWLIISHVLPRFNLHYTLTPAFSISLGFKEKDSAFLEQSVKICIRGQFFVLNKIR